MDAYTITFGDQAENNVGMQKIGKLSNIGFTYTEVKNLYKKLLEQKYNVELIKLSKLKYSETKVDKACVLIIRNGVNTILEENKDNDMYKEQSRLTYDKKALMKGKVKNKNARHNLCFDENSQEPDYENGKGRIIAYKDVPILAKLRSKLPKIFGEKAKNLVAEGNYYYDIRKTGIGFHGDRERRIVIAIRLGAKIPLHYQWFKDGKPIGQRIEIILNHGDMYLMSEKAVGYDWLKKKIPTLRHAAGCNKYLKVKSK